MDALTVARQWDAIRQAFRENVGGWEYNRGETNTTWYPKFNALFGTDIKGTDPFFDAVNTAYDKMAELGHIESQSTSTPE